MPKRSKMLSLVRDRLAALPGAEPVVIVATHYASGVGQRAEFAAMAACSRPMGISMEGMWRGLFVDMMGPLSRNPVPVFIDSGAYAELSSGKPITHELWRERLDLTMEIVQDLRVTQDHAGVRLPILVVAPDKVLDQGETLERLGRYRVDLVRLKRAGATILVPLQAGELTLAQLHRKVDEILGPSLAGWTPAIPLRRKAVSPEEMGSYLAEIGPARLHLLGVGPNSPSLPQVEAALGRGRRDAEVTMDSVISRASSVMRHIRSGSDARGRAIGRLLEGRYAGYGPAGPPLDYTDSIGDPSGYTTADQRGAIARQAGMTAGDLLRFKLGPGSFMGGDRRDEYPYLDLLLEQAYHAYAAEQQKIYARSEVLCEVLGERDDLAPQVTLRLPRRTP